jgi:hypothetical protein
MAEMALVDARIQVAGRDQADDLAGLWAWLNDEDELRGSVSPVERSIGETELGSATDSLTVVLGSTGVGAALSRSLITWLQIRRSDVRITVTTRGRKVEIQGTNIKEARPLLEEALRDADES